MQHVLVDVVRAQRRKRAGADVQSYEGPFDAARVERGEERSIEMQSGRRRGDCARRRGKDRLVANRIACFGRALDVRGQWDLAVRLEIEENVAIELELEQIAFARDDARRRSTRQSDLATWLRALARLDLKPRAARARHPLEQKLDAPTASLRAVETRRQHARVVEHE